MVEYIVTAKVIVDITPNGLVDPWTRAGQKVISILEGQVDNISIESIVPNALDGGNE